MNSSYPPKNPMIAFFFSCVPGLGQLYLGRFVRALFFGGGFFGALLPLVFMIIANIFRKELGFFLLAVAGVFWSLNLVDMIRVLARMAGYRPAQGSEPSFGPSNGENERFNTMLLSVIPGLGHLRLGLMQRGLSFLVSFFGLGVMILFVSIVTRQEGFLVFLGILPILWIYGLFDCIQQINKKERGETLIDRTYFEDFQEGRETGRKNKTLAMILSMFPGAGHMYLGLQKRGLQLMAAFLFSIYIMDVLRLSLFLFLIPMIWFFSFFDALQQIARYGREELRDVPVVVWLIHHQRWIGIGLLVMGVYYLFDHILVNGLDIWFNKETAQRIRGWYYNYFQTFVISVLLIGGGIRLLIGSQVKKGERS
ncbi:hypothetical protein LJK88_00145 [Paenibacillus sp. P26]|nr:hypothetical protein LJK88_00145 [Paenibacillus sp. P26]